MSDNRRLVVKVWLAVVAAAISFSSTSADEHTKQLLDQIGITRGICVLLGDPTGEKAIELAKDSELLVYLQLPQGQDVERARRAADETGYLGRRIYIDKGELPRLHLADNLADAVIAVGKAVDNVVDAEVLRVLRPQGKALLGRREIIKPVPEGLDDWSHPYHGPDNNPQSKDQIIRAPYLTQFLADPQYGPSPQITVASAGRVFKAFGNVAWHKREEQFLNKLVAFNGYNGTILWQRDLPPGVLLHRNTMIATPQILYVGDDESCKLIDTATGKLIDEIIPPLEVAGGTFWKWMGLQDGVLYALVGEQEYKDEVKKWNRKQHGWPWTGVSKGYDKPKHTWGYGKNVLAIDPKNKQVIWHHHEDEAIDSRAMCMKNGRIFIFRFGSFLACLDAKTGKERWRKTKGENPEIFESMGKYLNRQGWQTNWRTVVYLKCSDKALYFAGPQVGKLLAVSVEDGSILWENPYSNFQLVLRDDGLYGFSGPWGHNASKKFDPLTGEVLAAFDTGRRACTRPTGAIDAIFYRAMGGTIRFDLASAKPHWISPMRPQCHEGVTVANGYLYWWPWACDCQLTLLGVTCLGPAGDFNFTSRAIEAERLERFSADPAKVAPLPVSSVDWPTFRAGNNCTAITTAVVSKTGDVIWRHLPEDGKRNVTPTAPVTAGGMVFVGDDAGVVHAL
ncbi:MAG: PQQ-binding-like beta-propeller repeat protein, partial [Planctomycetota bacterium]